MSSFNDANISDFHHTPVEGPAFIHPTKEAATTAKDVKQAIKDTLEHSKDVQLPYVPIMNFPILVTPIAGSDKVLTDFLISADKLSMNSTINAMLAGWSKNLDEIDERTKDELKSSSYRAKQDIRIKGDTDDSEKLVSFTFTAPVMVGGALALASFEVTTTASGMSSAPMQASFEIIDKLQTAMPQLQDLMPYINLLAGPLLYFTSLDTAISNIKSKERHSNVDAAQNFAKEAIKMASDPAYVLVTVVNKMPGAEKFTPEHKQQLAAVLKLILTSTALSLLYSVQVGKAVDGKFWGMEPQEFKALLNGKIPIGDTKNAMLTETDKLKLTLLALIKAQLDVLPAGQKVNVLTALFEYLTTPKDIKNMLNPSTIFHDVFSQLAASESEGVNHLDSDRV